MITGDRAELLFRVFGDHMFLRDGVLTMPWHVAILAQRIEVIGAKCESTTCGELATMRCYWPGQTTVKCERCAADMRRLGLALGFNLVTKPLDVPRGADETAKRFSLLELN